MRLDKWLYYARLYKTRVRSNKACTEGEVLVNKLKKYNSSYNLSTNDIITIILDNKIKIIKVLKLPKTRISSKKVNEIYEII